MDDFFHEVGQKALEGFEIAISILATSKLIHEGLELMKHIRGWLKGKHGSIQKTEKD